MGTQLILTVGTNPLPVWVAWYHLKDTLDQPVTVRLVHTPETVAESDRLRTYCSGADFRDPIETDAGSPREIREAVRAAVLNDLPEGTDRHHFHYTGGTKVMSVEVLAGILLAPGADQQNLSTSYLNPRGNAGPVILSRANRDPVVADARVGVPAKIREIALLNGFTVGRFTHRFWDRGSYAVEDCPSPTKPSHEQLVAGTDALQTGAVDPDLLEYGAYASFKNALTGVGVANPDRRNYELFHHVYVRRARGHNTVKHFELDVVAVLGYQIVVVSCTVDRCHERIKQKGMEAIIRARQLGGDEARAIVLCGGHPKGVPHIQAELADETGSSDIPLQVWGQDKWRTLSQEFARYLQNDLRWC